MQYSFRNLNVLITLITRCQYHVQSKVTLNVMNISYVNKTELCMVVAILSRKCFSFYSLGLETKSYLIYILINNNILLHVQLCEFLCMNLTVRLKGLQLFSTIRGIKNCQTESQEMTKKTVQLEVGYFFYTFYCLCGPATILLF